jgi:hypothetical protein
MPVNANAAAAVGNTTKQRIRIIVSGTITDVADATISLSCLIRVSLCRIAGFDLLQSGTQAIDNEELSISAP